jgi:hypothetical protein
VSERRSIRRLSIALTLALVAGTSAAAMPASDAAAATTGDPLQAADCRNALAALKTEEAAADAASHASAAVVGPARATPSDALQAARKRAARSCLASRADPPLPPGRLIAPPIAVAPIAVARPLAPTAARAQPPLPTAPAAPRPYAVTSCDPGGCWANDGSRLNRVGPNLWGMRGVCTLQGTLLQCP